MNSQIMYLVCGPIIAIIFFEQFCQINKEKFILNSQEHLKSIATNNPINIGTYLKLNILDIKVQHEKNDLGTEKKILLYACVDDFSGRNSV